MLSQINIDKSKFFLIILCFFIFLFTFFSRFYNASDLSGGDDSQFAELGALAVNDPSIILYPRYPSDIPITNRGLHYMRPTTAFMYASSIMIFGHTKYAAIFPATLFSALSAILLYLILKRQFNNRIAVLSTTVYVFSPFLLAFTRIGLLHAQLIFLSLLAFYLYYRYRETKKIGFIYLSAFCWLLNAWTTDFRGLVTAFAYFPLIYFDLKKRGVKIDRTIFLNLVKNKMIIHLVVAFLVIIALYFVTILISPYESNLYIENLKEMFFHSLGHGKYTELYHPFLEALSGMLKILFLTPFLGFILIPFIFGIIAIILNKKSEQNLFWLFYLIPIALYYIQRQFVPERQLIFLPAFVVISVIGVSWAEQKLKKKRYKIIYLLTFLTIISYISLVAFFPDLFPKEWSGIRGGIAGFIVLMVAKYYYVLIGLIALLSALFIIISRLRRLLLKYISTFLIVIIIGINAGFCIAATLTGMGIYKRSTDISVIGEYIYKNLGNEPFSCVAGIHARTLTFYTGKPCLWWLLVNETWLEEHKEEVKYFVVEINLDAGGTGGLGKFTPTGELDLSNNNTREWGRNYPNKYRWLILNTVDITAETGLPSNNQNFRVYRLK